MTTQIQSRQIKKTIINIGNTPIKSTEKAICFFINGKNEWFPLNQIQYSLEKGKMQLPFWMAEKKGCLPSETIAPKQVSPAPRQTYTKTPELRQTPQTNQKQALIEEFAKIRAEVKLLNDRLLAIHNELSRGN